MVPETSVPIPPVLRSLVEVVCRHVPRGDLLDTFYDLFGDFTLDDRVLAQVAPDRVTPGGLFPRELHHGVIAFPEVVPFAWRETGTYFAHLVLAEELPASDWPVVVLDPVGGVGWIAADTRSALENRAAAQGRYRATTGEPAITHEPLAVAVIEALELTPHYDATAAPSELPSPVIPPGYHYVASSSGVGVLAPARTFDDRFQLHEALEDFEHIEVAIERLIEQGALGSALVALWAMRALGDHDAHRHAFHEMVGVYAALGRPIMARRAEALHASVGTE